MISKKMEGLVKGSSVIRAMFEEGRQMAAKYGEENVEFLMSYELEEDEKITRIYSYNLKESQFSNIKCIPTFFFF